MHTNYQYLELLINITVQRKLLLINPHNPKTTELGWAAQIPTVLVGVTAGDGGDEAWELLDGGVKTATGCWISSPSLPDLFMSFMLLSLLKWCIDYSFHCLCYICFWQLSLLGTRWDVLPLCLSCSLSHSCLFPSCPLGAPAHTSAPLVVPPLTQVSEIFLHCVWLCYNIYKVLLHCNKLGC